MNLFCFSEYYKKEQAKIKEIANKVKKTTKESVLKNVPKQIDELSALYINKIAELQVSRTSKKKKNNKNSQKESSLFFCFLEAFLFTSKRK